MSKKMRDSNIELLRILAVLGVIILHFNGTYGNAFQYVEAGTINYYTLRYLESLFIPAVNLFVMISGYYLCNSAKRVIMKPVYLIIQVIVFSEFTYALAVIRGSVPFSLKTAVGHLIPCNYYVILYAVVYLLSPYINLVIERLEEKQLKLFLGLSFSLFSVWPILVDVLQELLNREFQGLNSIGLMGDQNGYTIVNFFLMYIIGAYIKKVDVRWSIKKSIIMVISCSVALTIWSILLPQTAWGYCNPLVIMEAVAVFLLFKQLRIQNRFINIAAKSVYTCFLFHGYFVQQLPVSKFVEENVLILLSYIMISVLSIYFICWCAYCIYDVLEKYVLRKILKVLDKVVIDIKPQDKGELCK